MFTADENGRLIRKLHRLGEPPEPESTPLDREKNRIQKLLRFVDAGKVYDHEMYENLLYQFISMPNRFWDECADLLDDTRTRLFCKYIDDKLIPVDFEPSPMPFMVQWDPLVAEQKKRELKPKYKDIHEFWHNRQNAG